VARHIWAPKSLRRRLARSPGLRALVLRLEAVCMALAWTVLGWLPPERASALGAAVARRIGPHMQKHRHVIANLAVAFPELGEAERRALARKMWGNFGHVFAELPHLARIHRDPGRLEIATETDPALGVQPPHPAVFVTAHVGNWELTALAGGARFGIPLSVIYTPDANPRIDALIHSLRRDLPCELVAKQGGARVLLQALAKGRSVGFISDTRQDDGEPIPFFGIPAMTTTVPARLALRAGIPLVTTRAVRLGPAHYRVTFGPPILPDPALTDPREQARDMTRQVNACFTAWIREHPDQWLCPKRRWPKGVGRPVAHVGG
jgi:KDO2-lipid IV(A) lauroyltransferase